MYGNASFMYEYLRQRGIENFADYRTWESVVVNYEDILFSKNRLRFSANLKRRQFSFSDYREFRPIFQLDIRSLGYVFDIRYSPYEKRSFVAGSADVVDIEYRDWRFHGLLNYEDMPTLSMVYTQLKSTDGEKGRFDAIDRSLIAATAYRYKPLSLQASYNSLKHEESDLERSKLVTNAYTGTVGISGGVGGVGYFSTTYSLYDTERSGTDVQTRESTTHAVSAMTSLYAIRNLSCNASYSGRFFSVREQYQESESDYQNISTMATYAPAHYFILEAAKGYQVSSQADSNDVIEYTSFGASLNRGVYHGVDSRFAYNRTLFQQSLRASAADDESAKGRYTLDTFRASFDFAPINYAELSASLVLAHDHDPIEPDSRYQIVRSLDSRIHLTRRLEGRLAYTAPYGGAKFRLDKTASESYNLGLTYTPRGNLNIDGAYTLRKYKGSVSSTHRSFTGYISYSFRRTLSFYFSANRRKEKQEQQVTGSETLLITEQSPYTINGQVVVNLTRKTKLSLSYLHSQTESPNSVEVINQSVQCMLTIEI